ncbi:hypothetical protein [Robertkochia solimangrovi]|uniref:hypothetical protein n=1 Tax=Robertkochia solimangrovi TaxID=2213046 RepID=UPI00117E9FE3|nr:hypothetical protein [Robertkochia solimangrovi]TRZ43711.1 hypothetical protein DMZ48_09895 [Robertkochia solimangrovi]
MKKVLRLLPILLLPFIIGACSGDDDASNDTSTLEYDIIVINETAYDLNIYVDALDEGDAGFTDYGIVLSGHDREISSFKANIQHVLRATLEGNLPSAFVYETNFTNNSNGDIEILIFSID